MGRALAQSVNATGMDFISLDGVESYWYDVYGELGANVFYKTLFDNLDSKELSSEGSRLSHYNWHFHDRFMWGETANQMLQGTYDLQFASNVMRVRNFFPDHTGGFYGAHNERRDFEWAGSKIAALDAGTLIRSEEFDNEEKAALKRWNEAAEAGAFSDWQRARLQPWERAFALDEVVAGGRWRLWEQGMRLTFDNDDTNNKVTGVSYEAVGGAPSEKTNPFYVSRPWAGFSTRNVAGDALVSASSERDPSLQGDNVVDGYIGIHVNAKYSNYKTSEVSEWHTNSDDSERWIELTWDSPQRIRAVLLSDRCLPANNVTGYRLEFSSGSPVTGAWLPKRGKYQEHHFVPRESTSLKVTIDSFEGSNPGLAEIVVIADDPQFKGDLTGRANVESGYTGSDDNKLFDGNLGVSNFIGLGNGRQALVIDLEDDKVWVDGLNVWRYYDENSLRNYRDVIYQLSPVADFSRDVTTVYSTDHDNSAGQGTGSDLEFQESAAGRPVYFPPVKARYVRLWSNGNTVNSGNHYTEVEVYGMKNLARGITPTTNGSDNSDSGIGWATDGAHGSGGSAWNVGTGKKYAQIDLGWSRWVDSLRVWHYFADKRRYHDVIFQLSDDATFGRRVTTVFNNDLDNSAGLGAGTDGEYNETVTGKIVHFAPVQARYVRLYSNGHTKGSGNHYAEIMVGQGPSIPQGIRTMLGSLVTPVYTAGTLDLSTLVEKPDGVAVRYTVAGPSHGSVSLSGSVVTYTPEADYHGNDSFSFTATNYVDPTETSTGFVDVLVKRRPIANDFTVILGNDDTEARIQLQDHASDPDGDRLQLQYSLGTPSQGSVSLESDTGGTAIYRPGGNYTCEAFDYTVTDSYETGGYGYTTTATATVTLIGSKVPLIVDPITGDDTINIAEKAAGFAVRGNTGCVTDVGVRGLEGMSVQFSIPSSSYRRNVSSYRHGEFGITVPANAAFVTGTSVVLQIHADAISRYDRSGTISRTLTVDLVAPQVSYTPPDTLVAGSPITTMRPVTSDTDIATYSAAGLPPGLSIDPTSGAISGAPVTVNIATQAATVTATDDAGNPATVTVTFPLVTAYRSELTIADESLTEADTDLTFTVALSVASVKVITLAYETTNGTAAAGSDYTTTRGALTFAAGETTRTISVPILEDSRDEKDETFTVTLRNPVNSAFPGGAASLTATGIIYDDDDSQGEGMTMANQAIIEDATDMTFTAILDEPREQTVRFGVLTFSQTAQKGADYRAASPGLTFLPGVTQQPFSISILEDSAVEEDETFLVGVYSLDGTAGTVFATGTIIDDDLPVLSVAPQSLFEAAADMTFTVRLSEPGFRTVTLAYTTFDVTAGAGSDYSMASGTLTFLPGVIEQPISVSILEDSLDEEDEVFDVSLGNPVNAVFPGGGSSLTVSGTITNDDTVGQLTLGNARLEEADASMAFTVDLSGGSAGDVAVDYQTTDGAARADSDYTTARGTLTFAPGETTQTISVPILEDSLDEQDETFTVTLSNPVNAAFPGAAVSLTATGIITDDDGVLVLNLYTIAGDNIVNVRDWNGGFAISGDTGSKSGVLVVVNIGTDTLVTSSYAGAWSVAVPKSVSYLTSSVVVTVTATKPGHIPAEVSRILGVDRVYPSASYMSPTSLTVGVPITALRPTALHTDIRSYAAADLPPGLSINASSGVISGTPDTARASTQAILITITDYAGNFLTNNVRITFPAVAKGAQDLSGFAYSLANIIIGDAAPPLTVPGRARGALSYTSDTSSVCEADANSGALTILTVGTCNVTVTAAATANYAAAAASFTLTVYPPPSMPLNVVDTAGDNTINIAEKAAGFSVSGGTGNVAGADVTVVIGAGTLTTRSIAAVPPEIEASWSVTVPPDAAYISGAGVDLVVTAGKARYTDSKVSRSLTVDLDAPKLSYSPPDSLTVGTPITAVTPATGDTDIKSYVASDLPPGLVFDPVSGAISGTPDTARAAAQDARVTATDDAGNPTTVTVTFPAVAKAAQDLSGFTYSKTSVTYGDAPPTLTAPAATVTTPVYTAAPAAVCTVDGAHGALTLVEVGECVITVTAAANANYDEATADFTLIVNPVGTLALNVDAIAGDNTVNIAEQTAGFAVSGDTGSEAGVAVTVVIGAETLPSATSAIAAGETDATWSVPVPANADYVSGAALDLTVAAARPGYTAPTPLSRRLNVDLGAPTAPGYTVPASLTVGTAITAISPSDGTDIDAYAATGLPAGLDIDTSSGVINGTPTKTDTNTAGVTVTVTDAAGNPASVTLTLPVVARGAQDLSGFGYSPASLNFGATTPTLTAPTVAESAALSYASSTTGVCMVDAAGGALTIKDMGACSVTVTAAATDNYNAATASVAVSVSPAGALTLSVAAVSGDDTINIAEQAAGFSISGATGAEAGVTVTVVVGTETLASATSALAEGDSAATWSVPVPAAADYLSDGATPTLSVAAAKPGYTAATPVNRSLVVDLSAPAVSYTAPDSLTVGTAITTMSPVTSATDIKSYAATDLPPGLDIDAASGVISGTPDTARAATQDATVTLTDNAGNPTVVTVTFPAVAKGAQVLSGFAYGPASASFGTVPPLTAPSGARGDLSYASNNLSVCEVDANSGALTILTAGACEVTVTAAATANYNAATASFTLTVTKAAQTLSGFAYGPANIVFGDSIRSISLPSGARGALSYASDTLSVCEVDAEYGDPTILTAGTCKVTVTAAATANYNEGTASFTLTVAKAAQTLSGFAYSPASAPFGTVPTLTAPSGAQGALSYTSDTASVCTVDSAGGALTHTGVGTCSITVTAAATASYNEATASFTLTVTKADQTLSGFAYSPASAPFGTVPTLTAPSGAQGALSYASDTASVCTVDSAGGALTHTGVGTCSITVTAAATANYNEGTASFTLTVTKAAQTLSGFAYSQTSIVFGATAPTLTAPSGAQGALSYTSDTSSVCTVDSAGGALTLTGVGTCSVTVTAAATANYDAATASFTLTVSLPPPLPLNVVAVAGDGAINIAEQATGFSISGATGNVAGASVTVVIGTETLTTASIAAVPPEIEAAWSVTVPPDAAYISGTGVDLVVTAAKATYSNSVVRRTLAVDLVAPTLSYTAPATLTVAAASSAMTPTASADAGAYAAADLPSGLDIDAASGVISGTPDTARAATQAATVTATDSAGNPTTVTVTFPVVARGAQDLSGFGYSPASLNFGAPAPTLSAPTVTERAALSYTGSSASVCTVDRATGALTLLRDGACQVTVTAAATTNYNAATASVTLTVNPAGTLDLSVAAVSGDDTINIAEQAAGFSISGSTGTEAGVTVTLTLGSETLTAAPSAIAAGKTAATWSVPVPAAADYISATEVALTVAAAKNGYTSATPVKRTLTVDLVAPTLSYTAPASLTVAAAISAMAPTASADAGAYAAADLPSGLAINAASGVISGTPDTARAATQDATVTLTDNAGNPTTVTVTFPAVGKGAQALSGFGYSQTSVALSATPPTLSAPTGAVTTLAYTAAPAAVCTVDAGSGALTLKGVGECVISVSAAANANYDAATASFTLTVGADPALPLTLAAVAGDNTINITEKAAGFSIRGATGRVAAARVAVTLGGTALAAVTSAGDGAWSVAVPAAAAYVTGTEVALTVSASKARYSAATVNRSLTVDLSAPAVSYTAPDSLTVGTAITTMSPVTSATDIKSYAATDLPPGLAINAASGVISGTPDTASAATQDATVTLTDNAGNPTVVTVTFPAVAKGRQVLSGFAYSPASIVFGVPAPTLTAPSGAQGALSYTSDTSSVCTVNAATGALLPTEVGTCSITVTAAASANYAAATATASVSVSPAGALALSVAAVTGDNTINITEKAAGFSIRGATGSVADVTVRVTLGSQAPRAVSSAIATGETDATWSLAVPAAAAYVSGTGVALTVSASKGGYSAATVNRSLTVDLVAPTLSYTPPASLTVGAPISALTPTSSSTDIASYAAAELPPGLTIDSASGAISGTPDTARTSTRAATLTATDGAANPASVTVTFPAVAQGTQDLSGFKYSASAVALSATPPTLSAPTVAQVTPSYTAAPAAVCTVAGGGGALTLVALGECVISVSAAANANYHAATASFTLTVGADPALPLTLAAVAGDNTINITEKAAGFSIRGATGSVAAASVAVTLGGTALAAVTSAAGGAWSVPVPAAAAYVSGTGVALTVSASKGGYSATTLDRDLGVDLAAPTLSYTPPASLTVGAPISALTPTSSSTDIASYAAADLPPGLTINAASGAISGTPDTARTSTREATLTATDGAANATAASLTFPAVAKGTQDLSGFKYSASAVVLSATPPTLSAPTVAQVTPSYTAAPAAVCTVAGGSGALTLVALGECVISVTAAANANYHAATASFTLTVGADPALPLTLAAVAGDNTINITEKAAGFSIRGATGSVAGARVAVTLGGTALAAVTSATGGAWTVPVPAAAAYISGTGVALTVSASKGGYSATTLGRDLTVDLVAPTLSYTPPATLTVGAAISALTPTSSSTDIASYAAADLPPGLTINAASGAISGTPDTAKTSTQGATVTATDNADNATAASVTFPAVAKGRQDLSGFKYSATSVALSATPPTLSAPTVAQVTPSYTAAPAAVCTVAGGSGALTLVALGECVISVTAAANANYHAATASFTLTVGADPALPLTLAAVAGDNTINITEKAAGFSIRGATGSVAGARVAVTLGGTALAAVTSAAGGAWSVPVPAAAAYVSGTGVALTVSASKGGYSATTLDRDLGVDLAAPTLSYTPPASLTVGAPISALTPTSSSTDIASYAAADLPPGLTINAASGAISGTPDTARTSTREATLTATDGAANATAASLTFPAVAQGTQDLSGFKYSASAVALSATPPTLSAPTVAQVTPSYTAAPAAVCTVAGGSGALTLVALGECVISVTAAANANYHAATASFTLTVGADPALPLTLAAVAGDNTINITEKAAGFSIRGATGSVAGARVAVTLGGTALAAVTSAAGGAWSVPVPAAAAYVSGTGVALTVSASKGGYSATTLDRDLGVDLAAPTLSYTPPASLTVGAPISALTPTSSSTDIASYAAADLPPGLTINAASGAISGTPDTARTSTREATLTATDGAANATAASLTFPAVAQGTQDLSGFKYSASAVALSATPPTLSAPTVAQVTPSYTAAPAAVCTVAGGSGALTLVALGECVISVTAAANANYHAATASFTLTVGADPALPLTLAAVAGDNTINITEKAAGFSIRGATGSVAGARVAVTLGGTALAAVTSAAGGAWSVPVPAAAAYVSGTGVALTVSASKGGYSATTLDRDLGVDLAAPTLSYTPPASLTVGAPISALTPTSSSTDIASYAAADLPPGLTINAASGAISGTPDTARTSTREATLTATDGAANATAASLTFPAVAQGTQDLSGFKYSASAVALSATPPTLSAPTVAQVTPSYTAAPAAVCTVAGGSGALTLVALGECVISVTAAANANYHAATASFTLTVGADPALPLTLAAVAGDNTINITEKAAGFSIRGATGSVAGARVAVTLGGTALAAVTSAAGGAWSVPVPAAAAYVSGTGVALTVSASKGGYSATTLDRDLGVDLAAPTLSYTPPASLTVGAPISALTPTSSSTDIASYAAADLPPGLTINAASGAISGTPDTAKTSTQGATVTATDNADNATAASVTFPAVAKGRQDLSGFKYSASAVALSATPPTLSAPTVAQVTPSYTAAPAAVGRRRQRRVDPGGGVHGRRRQRRVDPGGAGRVRD